jgi:hypothetical protein
LDDDGLIVFTTRGNAFLNHIEKNRVKPSVFEDYSHVRAKYNNGEFQFFLDRTRRNELSDKFFGEAFIPKQYIERKFGAKLLSFTESVPYLNQAVIVLRRT